MNDKHFSLENILSSTVLHLVLAAVMVTSFFIVVERAKLVTPDRIEITEIDLSNVKITRDETRLYNTAAPKPTETVNREPITEGDDEPIEKPTMVEDKKVEDVPAPRTARVVRVNRETVSLDRTMTVSVVDALRVALTRCWVVDTTRADLDDIRAVAHLTMYNNGNIRDVWFEGATRADTDPAFAYVLETIRDALQTCAPFKMLPSEMFGEWEKIQLTFYPVTGKIM